MTSRTAFHLDCTLILAECECKCGRCIEEMKAVFSGTAGVSKFYREGPGVVVEHDPSVATVEQSMDVFRGLPEVFESSVVGRSGRPAPVAMVKPADSGQSDDPAQARRFDGHSLRRILPKRKRALRAVVVVEVAGDLPPQRGLV